MIKDLSYVLNRVKLDKEITSNQYDMKIRQLSIDGLNDLIKKGLIASAFKTARLKVENKVADFSHLEDFRSYVKIGTCIGGKLVTYNLNENLCTEDEEVTCCPVPQTTEDNNILFYPVWGNYNGVWCYNTPYYSSSSQSYTGGYKIDYGKRKIYLDFSADEIVMEYTGGVENAYLLDSQEICIRYYVYYTLAELSRNREEREMYPRLKSTYNQKVKELFRETKGLKAYEIVDIINSCFRQIK